MFFFFFFKQKTAYEIPKRDWSADVCSSDLPSAVVASRSQGFIGREHNRPVEAPPYSTARIDVVRVPGGRHEDVVAVEEPLEIRISGSPVAVTMRTPGHDEELALG